MSRLRHSRVALSLVLALVVAAFALSFGASPAKAAPARAALYTGTCWCTEYVSNYWGLTGFPNAYLWGSYLTGKGWHHTDTVANGEIIVFQRSQSLWVTNPNTGNSFYWTTDAAAGHVAIVANAVYHSLGPYWSLTIKGAHQNVSGDYTDHSCTDVTNLNWGADGSVPGSYDFYTHP